MTRHGRAADAGTGGALANRKKKAPGQRGENRGPIALMGLEGIKAPAQGGEAGDGSTPSEPYDTNPTEKFQFFLSGQNHG